jgi:hypothetical protein
LRRPEKETDFPTMSKLGYGRNLFGIITAWWMPLSADMCQNRKT